MLLLPEVTATASAPPPPPAPEIVSAPVAVPAADPLALRPYQRELVEQVRRHIRFRGSSVLLQSVTGSGKSRMMLAVADRFERVAYATSRRLLVEQVLRAAAAAGIRAGQPQHGRWPENIQLLVGGVTRINNCAAEWRSPKPDGAKPVDLLIVDEAHHAAVRDGAREYPIAGRLIARTRHAGGCVVGCSGTPWRMADDEGFDALFDHLVPGSSVADLVSLGFLCPISVRETSYTIRAGRLDKKGDYDVVDIERLNPADHLYSRPIGDLAELTGSWSRPAIVYCARQHIAARFARELAAAHPACRVGLLVSDVRHRRAAGPEVLSSPPDDVGAAFRRGDLHVVVNVAMLTEGYDAPSAEVALVLRPTRSQALWRQIAGRLMRKAGSKSESLLVDAGGNRDRLLPVPAQAGTGPRARPAVCVAHAAHAAHADRGPARDQRSAWPGGANGVAASLPAAAPAG